MTSAPNAYASRRSRRLRRPVLSTNTGAGAAMVITSVSGLAGSVECGFSGSCEVTRPSLKTSHAILESLTLTDDG